MATPNPFHVYVPESSVWELDQIRALDPKSDEFKELIVRLYQNMNVHAMAINRNIAELCPDPPPPQIFWGITNWIEITEPCGAVEILPRTGYVANSPGFPINFVMPNTMEFGIEFAIISKSFAGWRLFLNSGQIMYPKGQRVDITNQNTEFGLAQFQQLITGPDQYLSDSGSIVQTFQRQGIQALCVTADTEFVIRFGEYKARQASPAAFYWISAAGGANPKGSDFNPNNGSWIFAGNGFVGVYTGHLENNFTQSYNVATGVISNAIVYSSVDDLWVIAGQAGLMKTAPGDDPGTWTIRVSQFFALEPIYGLEYDGVGLYVAVGVGLADKLSTSTDGITWVARSGPAAFGAQVNGVAFGNGVWIMVGNTGGIATTTDPTAGPGGWTTRTSGTGEDLQAVAFGENCSFPTGVFVAVGDNGAITASYDNGATWTLATSVAPDDLTGVTLVQDEWYASVLGTVYMYRATDPRTIWNVYNRPIGATWSDVRSLSSDGKYVMATSSGAGGGQLGEVLVNEPAGP